MHVCPVLSGARKGVGSHGAEVRGYCELRMLELGTRLESFIRTVHTLTEVNLSNPGTVFSFSLWRRWCYWPLLNRPEMI